MAIWKKQTSLFQQLVRLQPNNQVALLLLAQSLQRESKHAETIVVLRRILQLKPDSAECPLYALHGASTDQPGGVQKASAGL